MLSLTLDLLTSPTLLITLLPLSLFLIYHQLSPKYKFPAKAPPLTKVSGVPILGALQFFSQRWDFWRHSRDEAGGSFTFFAGKYPVVALNGAEGRKLFFESKELDIQAGYVRFFFS
jgi:sterol 14-demethylase